MISRRLSHFLQDNPHFLKLTSFSLILFFILLGDGILSYWVPNLLQDSLGNSFLMGITMSFSSFVGFGADIVFPQLLRNYSVRRLLMSAVFVSLFFIANLAFGVGFPKPIVFLVAMAIWGIYYEFLGFATQQFIADTMPLKLRSTGWALLDIFKNLAYLLGPILAGYFLLQGEYILLSVVALFVVVSLLVLSFTGSKHERKITIESSEVNIWKELSHWKVLFKKVWPIIFLSLFAGLIDATFWTTGAVWTERLASENVFGVFLLPAYQLPTVFMGFVVAKMLVFKGKKRIAAKYLMYSGLTLVLLIFRMPVIFYVLIVFVSSIFLAVTYPMIEAVYSDIIARMGVERKHLVGLSSSTMSLAYIISPAIAGFSASLIGEQMTFVILGGTTAVFAFVLRLIMPKKIRLPKEEISEWSTIGRK